MIEMSFLRFFFRVFEQEIMNAIGESASSTRLVDHFVGQMMAVLNQQMPARIRSSENAVIDVIVAYDAFTTNLIECINDIVSKKAYQHVAAFMMEM